MPLSPQQGRRAARAPSLVTERGQLTVRLRSLKGLPPPPKLKGDLFFKVLVMTGMGLAPRSTRAHKAAAAIEWNDEEFQFAVLNAASDKLQLRLHRKQRFSRCTRAPGPGTPSSPC